MVMEHQPSSQTGQSATLNLNSIMIGTADPERMANFYAAVFGRAADMVEGDWHMWQVGACALSLGLHSEVQGASKEPARIMLNLETKHVKEEFERLKLLNTTIVKEPYEMGGGWIATLADPDGNFIQLITPWE